MKIKDDEEVEKLLEQQDKELQLQNKISKLSLEKQSLYFEWKKKGIDKLGEIEKWDNVENSSKIKNERQLIINGVGVSFLILSLFGIGLWKLLKKNIPQKF